MRGTNAREKLGRVKEEREGGGKVKGNARLGDKSFRLL